MFLERRVNLRTGELQKHVRILIVANACSNINSYQSRLCHDSYQSRLCYDSYQSRLCYMLHVITVSVSVTAKPPSAATIPPYSIPKESYTQTTKINHPFTVKDHLFIKPPIPALLLRHRLEPVH